MWDNYEQYDGQYIHPFRCTLSGPSQSGKSTWVYNFLKRQGDLIDVTFDVVTIVLGTDANKNKILCDLKKELAPIKVEIIELKKIFPDKESLTEQFTPRFEEAVKQRKAQNLKQCVIFDDLMSELAECDILVDIFTKYSSHYDISTIHITQNLFFKGGGKRGTDSITVYRNTNILVLFNNPMDNTTIEVIARRLSRGRNFRDLVEMFYYILENHRYLVIVGDQRVPSHLKFRTDIFALDPIPHQTVYALNNRNRGF